MIGQLINEFENAQVQTVSQFNAIFKYCMIPVNDYPINAEVEIGGIAGCDKIREIKINGKTTYHEFHVEGVTKKMGNQKSDRPIVIFDNRGEKIGEFVGMCMAALELGISTSTIYKYKKDGTYIIKDVA